jgi:isochorismate pyruvate lyase
LSRIGWCRFSEGECAEFSEIDGTMAPCEMANSSACTSRINPPNAGGKLKTIKNCVLLAEVRDEIDRIDQAMLALLAERGGYVQLAARFKKDAADVPAPERVRQVLEKVRARAVELGADPEIAEATWKAMIAAFIVSEQAEHARLMQGK